MLHIGCSGWAYKDWKGPFYPDGTRDKDRLAFYATQFSTAEINASFYRLPTEKAVAGWAEQAPDGFVFAWKVSRYVTHNKRLKDCKEASTSPSGGWSRWASIWVPPSSSSRPRCGATTSGWRPSSAGCPGGAG